MSKNKISTNIIIKKNTVSKTQECYQRSRECFNLKADKNNKIVILDKSVYYERVNSMITNGLYKILPKNPLPISVR